MRKLALVIVCAALAATSPAWASRKLIREKACAECHDAQKQKVGPSWRQVGKLYKRTDAEAELARKIREGASDHWGDKAMPSAAARGVAISEAEAKSMAHYILRYR